MLKKMAMNIGSVSLVLILVMVFASLSSILLARLLPDADWGEFSLMRMLVLFIPFLAIWGQGIATARFFSKNDPTIFNWHAAFIKVAVWSALLAALCVAAAAYIYNLELYKIVALYISVVFFCSTLFLANLVRSQRRYTQAIIMENGFRGLFFFILLIIYLTASITKPATILIYLGLVVVFGFFNIGYAFRSIGNGERTVPAEMHRTGILLMGIEVSVDVLSSLDTLLIPKILDYGALGLYSAVLAPAQVFNILARAAKYVWVPEFGRSERTRFRLLTVGVFTLAVVMALALALAAKPLLHVLYNGKYDHGALLLQIMAAAGVFRLLYSLSSSLIVGRLGHRALVVHLRITIAAMALYALLLYWFLFQRGVVGAAWALLMVTALRAGLSYWVVLRFQRERC